MFTWFLAAFMAMFMATFIVTFMATLMATFMATFMAPFMATCMDERAPQLNRPQEWKSNGIRSNWCSTLCSNWCSSWPLEAIAPTVIVSPYSL